MLTKNDFSAPDWNTLRDTQYLVGFAMVMAGASGLGTIKELAALSQQIIQNQASGVPLIRDLTATSEMQAAQASLKQSFGGQEAKTHQRQQAAARAGRGTILACHPGVRRPANRPRTKKTANSHTRRFCKPATECGDSCRRAELNLLASGQIIKEEPTWRERQSHSFCLPPLGDESKQVWLAVLGPIGPDLDIFSRAL